MLTSSSESGTSTRGKGRRKLSTTRPTRRWLLGGIWTGAVLAGAAALYVPSSGAVALAGQTATFRSSVDLVAVDVQVVGDDGTPIKSLGQADFEVSISGGRRRVVSAEYIQTTEIDGTPFQAGHLGPAASNARPVEGDATRGRVYVLSFDVGGLGVGDSRVLARSALTFIDRLLPTDRVGLHTFPIGPLMDPTTDHAAVRQMVQKVVGSRTNSEGFNSRFNLSPSEIIDITAESTRASPFATRGVTARGTPVWEDAVVFGDETDTIRMVQMRECGAAEVRCGDEVRAEAMALAHRLEAHAVGGINGIRSLIRLLSAYPGRKTVVMFTPGMPTSDRPGGLPDLGSLARALGKDAAATNTTIYTLHVDSTQQRAFGAGTGRASGSPGTQSRDRAVESLLLEEFADASGGALLRVPTGAGESALDRVLRETSSHYLLGVEPQASDRDGTLRKLSVKVRRSGVTLRSREWVTVPLAAKPRR